MKKFIITIAACIVLFFTAYVIAEYVATGLLIRNTGSAKPVLKMENVNNNALGPIIEMRKIATGSAADYDDLGAIDFYGLDDGDHDTRYAFILAESNDVTDGDEAGNIRMNIKVDAVSRYMFEIIGNDGGVGEAAIVFNNDSVDVDFRVESDNSENALFVEGSTGNVSISHNLTVGGIISGMVISQAYGVQWDEDNSSPTLTRTGALASFPAAASPGNAVLPIQAAMVRVILDDDGVEVYELCPTDSTLKADCSTASVLDGTDGQVMVRIDKFAFKYSYAAATNIHNWSISSVLLPGYEWHPAFYKDGAWVDHRYIGAYEGIGWDNGTSAYFDGDDVLGDPSTNWPGGGAIDLGNDELGSVSGFAPLVNETRAEFRAIALNRGAGWRQQDFYLISAIQLLYLVEYASFYSQDVIGMGRTEIAGGTWEKDSNIGVTGKSNGDGNATGNIGGNSNDAYMSYRGIENFYGNLHKWVDGFNIDGGIPYVSNTETDFADDTAAAYFRLEDTGGSGITLLQGATGYQKTLKQIKYGFLPSAIGGSSSTYITDYYYQAANWRVARHGSDAAVVSAAGIFCWHLNDASANDYQTIAGRLAY